MAQQQTTGIKIAQPGYNVANCPDYDLIFNSSWPSLAIVFDQVISVTYDSFGNPSPASITHNLGFYSLTMAWQFTDNTQTVSMGRVFPDIGKNQAYFPAGLTFSATVYLNIKCYNLDITTPQSYNYIQPPAINNVYDPTYGIKVVKQNQSIASTDMRSFILHSRCASPQVLAVITETTPWNAATGIGNNNNVITYTNPQNYTSWAFGYAAFNGNGNIIYVSAPPVTQSYPGIQFNGGNYGNNSKEGLITMPVINSGDALAQGSIIILRDPLLAANTIQAYY